MSADWRSLVSRRRLAIFLCLWVGSVLLLFAWHLLMGFYHPPEPQWWLPCMIGIWIAPGIACFCLVFIQWLWASDTSILRKVCFSVLALAVAGPMTVVVGFIWMLLHMAP
jgi:hypothetical protein